MTAKNTYTSHHQLVRILSPDTGRPTTLSIDHVAYIRWCQALRCIKAVNAVVREVVAELQPVAGTPFSVQVAEAVTRKIAGAA